MAWFIDHSKIDPEPFPTVVYDKPGRDRPRNAVHFPFAFRLLDDNGEVYYHGRSTDNSSEKAFSPLDNYGMPNAGCTEIQYFNKGRWEAL